MCTPATAAISMIGASASEEGDHGTRMCRFHGLKREEPGLHGRALFSGVGPPQLSAASKRLALRFLRTWRGSTTQPLMAITTPLSSVCTAPTAQPMLHTASEP